MSEPQIPAQDQSLLASLNPEQRLAVTHGNGPLLIVAGAGTGKTTTLVHRVAWLISQGTDPGRILLLTFTRRSAAEMLRRVDSLLATMARTPQGQQFAGRRVVGGTFHAIGTRLLRQHGGAIGLSPDFTILDRSDSEDLLNVIRTELDLAKKDKRFPLKGTCLDIYSRCVNTQLPLATVLKETFPWCLEHEDGLKALFRAFTERKEQEQILDYDDLLLFWQALLEEPAGDILREKFDAVLVDEYQDTNTLQGGIVRLMRPGGQGLTVVGDDAQSIYSFRAANVRNILDFPDEFPGTTIVTLEQNYRSTMPILEATNRVIALAAEGHRKQLWSQRAGNQKPVLATCLDEDLQSRDIVEQVLALREAGTDLRRQAVLFRASHHSAALEVELSRQNIPFVKFGGLKFLEAAHIKDLMAFLRLAENPRDTVSALRVLMLLPGIGPQKSKQLVEQLRAAEGNFEVWRTFQAPTATALHWPLFVALMRMLGMKNPARKVAAEVHQVRQFYTPLLQEKYDYAQPRLRDLEQLEQMAGGYDSRSTFLNEITLDPPSSTQDVAQEPLLDEDYLTLSTIHSAKGLEWDAVYLLHAADGNIPSDMATKNPAEIEEERRLFYVALTRARTHLTVYHPQRYYFHSWSQSDQHSLSQRTRFIPDDLLPLFEPRTIQPRSLKDLQESLGEKTTAEIRQKISKMWN